MPVQQSHFSDNSSDNFFSSLAVLKHSLSTPITNLLINLELILQDPHLEKLKPNSDLYLQRSLLSAKYLHQIMSQCNFKEHLPHPEFVVKDSLFELVEICKNPKQKGLLVPFIQLNGNEKLSGNKLYFQEMVICLLNNAFQAYDKFATNKLVMLFVKVKQNQLVLKVTDKGRGFLCLKDSGVKKINSQQIKPKGTGLSFIEQVVVDHFSGKILIESQPQNGTTVHCTLPLSSQ